MTSISESNVQSKIQKFREALDYLGDSLSKSTSLKPEKIRIDQEEYAASPRPNINESAEILHLTQLLEAEKENVSTLKKRMAHKDKLINDLTQSKDKLESEVQSLRQSLVETQQALTVKEEEIDSIRLEQDREGSYAKEVGQIKDKLAEIEFQNNGVLSEVHRLKALVKTKEEKIQRVTEEKARVVKELGVYNKRVSLIDKENKDLKDALNCINTNEQRLLELMKVKDPQDAYAHVVYLMQTHDQLAKSGELVHRISQLISELSPPNSFSGGVPSHPQIWTWLANLLSQFMKYKQSAETRALYELSELLNVPPTNIVKKVRSLLKS